MDNYHQKYLECEIDKYTLLIENEINIKENLILLKKFLKEYFIFIENEYKLIEFQKKESLLSNRENEVYKLILEGFSNYEISKKLWITTDTIKKHVCNIYEKMGAKSIRHLLGIKIQNLINERNIKR